MRPLSADSDSATHSAFIESLSSFSRLHRAQRWEGTFGDFLANILPANPAAMARTSHEYIWDMLRWHGRDCAAADATDSVRAPRAVQARAVRHRRAARRASSTTSRRPPRAPMLAAGCCCC